MKRAQPRIISIYFVSDYFGLQRFLYGLPGHYFFPFIPEISWVAAPRDPHGQTAMESLVEFRLPHLEFLTIFRLFFLLDIYFMFADPRVAWYIWIVEEWKQSEGVKGGRFMSHNKMEAWAVVNFASGLNLALKLLIFFLTWAKFLLLLVLFVLSYQLKACW